MVYASRAPTEAEAIGLLIQLEGAEQVESTLSRVRNSIGGFAGSVRNVTVGMGSTTEEAGKLATSFSRLGGVIAQASIVTFVTAIGLRQMATAQERVRDAQYRLNRTLEKYGAGSREVAEAQRNMTVAQQNLNYSTAQFAVQMILTGVQVTALIAKLLALRAAAMAAGTAFMGIPGIGWGAIAIGGVAAVGLGAMYIQSQVNIQGSNEADINSALDAENRRRKGRTTRALLVEDNVNPRQTEDSCSLPCPFRC